MGKVIPMLTVSNMARSVEFYEGLGFVRDGEGIVDEQGSQWYSYIRDDATVWLLREDASDDLVAGAVRGNGVHIYLTVEDIDSLYGTVQSSGMKIQVVKEIETLWYGMREFSLADPDGYVWTMNMQTEQTEGASVDRA